MIGHSVLAPGNSLNLSTDAKTNADGSMSTSQKAVFGVQLAGAADSVTVNIRDSSGKVIQSLDLGAQQAGTLPIVWDGATDSGAKVADGAYTFDVSATSAGDTVGAKALTFGTVSSVSTSTDGVKLNVSNIGTIKPTEVIQIL
jgi:flagellar basal-body rod modification protein FlgD